MSTQSKVFSWISTHKRGIVYWIATLWLSLGMVSTGAVQFLQDPATVEVMVQMGYPLYFLTLLGIAKVIGVVIILIPKFPLLKEWAYAGFFYVVAGAAFTYVSVGNYDDLYHLGLFLALIAASWYFRPASRKLA